MADIKDSVKGDVIFFKDVLAKSLRDREFCLRLTQTSLKADHFPRGYMGWAYSVLKGFVEHPKYGGKLPSLKVFKDKLEGSRDVDASLKAGYYERIKSLYQYKLENEEYSFDVVESKIRAAEFKIIIKETIIGLDQFTDPNVAIDNLVQKSFKLSTNNNYFQITDLLDTYDVRAKEREFRKTNPQLFKRFRFHIKSVDACAPGGLYAGMFATIAAKTGRGKSIFTVKIGVEGIRQGFNVTHLISENDLVQTTGRYDSCISGIEYDSLQLSKTTKEQNKKIALKFKMLREKYKAHLKIVKVEPNQFNAATILQAMNVLEGEGHKTDILIIDSPDLMQSVAPFRDKRLQQSSIYWEIKSLLLEKKCIGFATTQLKALSKDEDPLAEDLSEAYDKARLLDFVLVMVQNKTQRANKEAFLVVVKNRDGRVPAEPILIATEFERMRLYEKAIEEEDEEPQQISSTKKKGGPTLLKVVNGGKNDETLSNLRKLGGEKKKVKK